MTDPEPKGILDQMDDLEAKRKAKKEPKKDDKKSKDLDLDRVW